MFLNAVGKIWHVAHVDEWSFNIDRSRGKIKILHSKETELAPESAILNLRERERRKLKFFTVAKKRRLNPQLEICEDAKEDEK